MSLIPYFQTMKNYIEKAILGAGCFWCIEAIYKRLEGVKQVQSGYCGGTVKNPTYREVCEDRTGHAEVCEIEFDSNIITFKGQNNTQKIIAEESKNEFCESKYYKNPIITEISAFEKFYPAENDHKGYFESNGQEPYCRLVILPKLEKFKNKFAHKLKKAKD